MAGTSCFYSLCIYLINFIFVFCFIKFNSCSTFYVREEWKSPEIIHKVDVEKMKRALEHGITIIGLYQREVFRENWKQEDLLKYLKIYPIPTVKCISNTSIYDRSFADYIIRDKVNEIIEQIL